MALEQTTAVAHVLHHNAGRVSDRAARGARSQPDVVPCAGLAPPRAARRPSICTAACSSTTAGRPSALPPEPRYKPSDTFCSTTPYARRAKNPYAGRTPR